MSSTAVAAFLSSGVGQIPGISDGIGDLYEPLAMLPGVAAFLHRYHYWHRGKERMWAERLAREHESTRIILVGHSRGVEFCVDTAAELQHLGRRVDCLFSADGWSKSGELLIPANVAYVESWTQTTRFPKGVPIRCAVTTRLAYHPLGDTITHNRMDSLPEFHAAVLAAARGAA